MGVVATPPILVEGQESEAVPPSPGGVGLDVSAGEFGAKPPFGFTSSELAVEGEKFGMSQEYPPAVTRSDTTNFCLEVVAVLKAKIWWLWGAFSM